MRAFADNLFLKPSRWLGYVIMLGSMGPLLAQNGPGGVGSSDGTSALSIWLDGNQVQQDAGSQVIVWRDRSGYRNHAVVTSEAGDCCGPVLSAELINGNKQLEFNGVDNYLSVRDNHTLRSDSFSLFVVGNIAAESGEWAGFVMKNLSGNWENGFGIVRDWGRQNLIGYVGDAARHSRQFDFEFGENGITSLVYDQRQIRLYRNDKGMQPYEIAIASSETKSDLWIGWTSGYLAGDISEVIYFQKAVNDVERIVIHNYLSAKYDLNLENDDLYVLDDSVQGDFDYHVAGIGRLADCTLLKAQGSGVLTVSNPTNLDVGEFLIWGSREVGPDMGSNLPVGVEGLMDVEWGFNELSTAGLATDVGAVDIVFDLRDRGDPFVEDLTLLIDREGDGYENNPPLMGAQEVGQGLFRFANVKDISDGVRMALGTTNIQRSSLAFSPLPIEPLRFNLENTPVSGKTDPGSTVMAILLVLSSVLALGMAALYHRYLVVRKERDELLQRIENWPIAASVTQESTRLQLDQQRIHDKINSKLNITDWRILKMLCEDPLISNKELAEHVSLSVEGTSSSLRKMYRLFGIKGSSNKKMVLVKEAMLASLPEN